MIRIEIECTGHTGVGLTYDVYNFIGNPEIKNRIAKDTTEPEKAILRWYSSYKGSQVAVYRVQKPELQYTLTIPR